MNGVNSVSGCPTGYTGKWNGTGIYFVGSYYMTFYIIFCSL
jgi:hypothetical protein